MTAAIRNAERETLLLEYELTAWQTAALMNATGNYKRKISPTDLFDRSKLETEEKEKKSTTLTREEKNRKFSELLSKFQ